MNSERFGAGFGAGVALAIGLVLASLIFGLSFVRARRGDQTITVTGSARKRIKSDLVIWSASVSYQAPVLADAYRSLSETVPRVKQYLIGKGIAENQITISSISSQTHQVRDSNGQETRSDLRLYTEAGTRGALERGGEDFQDRARSN